jgi:hypothetical protein
MSIADVNGDGIPDIFIPGSDPTAGGSDGTVYLGHGDGTFQLAGVTSPKAFIIADLNGDGFAELIGADEDNGQLLIWPGTGDSSFNSTPLTFSSFPLVGYPPMIKVADIDGDGHLDIIVRGNIYFGKGNLQFDAVQTSFGDPFAIGDFNNDGKLDVFTGSETYLNNGNRTFTSVFSGLNPSSAVDAVTGDFNGDGILDLATSYTGLSSGGLVLINYGRGDGTFYTQGEVGTADPIKSIAVGDFNGDGRDDIVVGVLIAPQIGVLTNDGQGGFQITYTPSGGTGNQGSELVEADLNRDGKPDLAVLTDSAKAWILLSH